MFSLIDHHHVAFAIVVFWIGSAFIDGAPEPTPTSSAAYKRAYTSLHLLAGNVTKAVNARYGVQLGLK